jgi:putative transposase
MPDYRRAYIPGSTVFLTLVTYQRQPIFSQPENVDRLRQALANTLAEYPFTIAAAVVLPDHLHFLWTLPEQSSQYSQQVGRLKALFTQSLRGKGNLPKTVSFSRQKHRESDVWQRRFWEHTIRDESDFYSHVHYIHFNPVKHGLVNCPHQWLYSSFHRWVDQEFYDKNWGCVCYGRMKDQERFGKFEEDCGE